MIKGERSGMPSERDGISPWTPAVLSEKAAPEALTSLGPPLVGAIEAFCKGELGVAQAPQHSSEERNTISAEMFVSGFDDVLECVASHAGLYALCAAAFGGQVSRSSGLDAIESPLLTNVMVQVAQAFLDVFCEVASRLYGREFRRIETIQSSGVYRQSAPSPQKRSLRISAFAIDIEYRLALSDAARFNLADNERLSPTEMQNYESELRAVVDYTCVTLDAILDDRTIEVEELKGWHPGLTVALSSHPKTVAKIYLDDVPLLDCEIVRHDDLFALRVLGACQALGGNAIGGA